MFDHIRFIFSAAELSVIFESPPNTPAVSFLDVTSGEELNVRCSLTCGARCPSARVKWLDSNRAEVSTSSTDDVWQDSPVTERLSTLKIKSTSLTNTGEYFCRASSSGEKSTYTSLILML